MSLRFDDVQGLSASRTTLSKTGLRSILGRSKTTGAGKRTGEIPCYVRLDASFSGHKWLEVGFKLFKEASGTVERDFFLPVPTDDLEDFGTRMLDYSYAAALSRKVLLGLRVPARVAEGGWVESEAHLIFDPAHLFQTEHSERHWATSVSAVLKVPRDGRNFLGRWGINGPQQSSDYVMTSRTVILEVQALMMRSICSGPSAYDEEDLFCLLYTSPSPRDS